MQDFKEIRQKAWDEYQKRINEMGYTPEQHRVFLSGLFVMWRFIGLDQKPLFTFGADGLPTELESE